jgi:hypothetical protein
MVGSPQQPSINLQSTSIGVALDSFDQRYVDGLVPAGTTASYQKLRIPGPAMLVRLSWSAVLAPGAGESIAVRLFRVRPASDPAGFGFVQLNSTYTIDASTYTGPGNSVDISSTILPDRCVLSNEYLACSWVHAGAAVMQPLNVDWNFAPANGNEPEPPATTTVYADVFG